MVKFLFFFSFLSLLTSSCSISNSTSVAQNSPPSMTPTLTNPNSDNAGSPSAPSKLEVLNAQMGWNKNLMVDDVPYDLYIPKDYKNRVVVVLPGWNFSRTSWIENAPLIQYAEQYGYALILPEMLQTLYESSYYPETNLKWNSMPGGKFIQDRFIPTIQQRHNLLKPGQNNTLLGLSTGGRGVALIALENPDLFVAGASLSGDFSQENTPEDRLMTAVYGSFSQFPERWQGRDNPMARATEWKMPLYLAHGTVDDIVPESQSRLFYQALIRNNNPALIVEYHPVEGAGHDYQFWGGQLPVVFNFFEKTIHQNLSSGE
jgi:S-formylglutathione hydrolase FrmB